MDKYNIFTICTENYKDALDVILPSWLNQKSINNIVIYSDFDIIRNDIICNNIIPYKLNWMDIVSLKPQCLIHYLNKYDYKRFIYLDIDCYIVNDISHIFNYTFDISAARMNEKIDANSGVFFANYNDNIKRFANEWFNLTNKYIKNKPKNLKLHRLSEQRAFSDILHNEYNNFTYLNVLPLNKYKYNYENDNIDEWLKNINKYKPNILHFKGCRWREKKMLNYLKENPHG